MIYERKFEERSRGLICGPATEVVDDACVLPIRRKRGDLFFGPARPISPEWRPWTKHYKVVISAREGGEIIWQRPFATWNEALFCYAASTGLDFQPGHTYRLPSIWVEADICIRIATVATFNATNTDSANDWDSGGNKAPPGVSSVEYLAVAGGGSGGTQYGSSSRLGGGGGAGGYRTASGYSVTPGTSYTITVGAGGAASASGYSQPGNNGGNTVFDAITSTGGGKGGSGSTAGGNGGSGGGGGSGSGATAGGTGTSGQGNNGGSGTSSSSSSGGGGGGAGSVGGNFGSIAQSNGGSGTANAISGASVTYAIGGDSDDAGTAEGTANSGSGSPSGATQSVAARDGVIVLSYTPTSAKYIFTMPMLGM